MFSAVMILILCGIVTGLAFVFSGEKNFMIISASAGFLGGGLIAFMELYARYSLTTSLIFSMMIGIGVACLIFFCKMAVRIIIGMLCGMVISYVGLLFITSDMKIVLPVVAVCGATLAVLNALRKSFFTAICTSVFGAGVFTGNFILLIFDYTRLYSGLAGVKIGVTLKYFDVLKECIKSNIWVFLGVCVVLTFVGVFMQIRTLPRLEKFHITKG